MNFAFGSYTSTSFEVLMEYFSSLRNKFVLFPPPVPQTQKQRDGGPERSSRAAPQEGVRFAAYCEHGGLLLLPRV